MSGIYGFFCHSAEPAFHNEVCGGLEYWTRVYGKEASDSRLLDCAVIGCHIEHFSDSFPYGGPILEYHGCPAVVDALLFNRDELTASLDLSAGSAISDEELLLMLIDRKGFEALAEVNGDFAGAIYDPRKQEWTLFRDHMGMRPLYYYCDDNIFAFSTDLRGLLAIPGADTRFDEHQIYSIFMGLPPASLTATDFARIRCALPAHVTSVHMTGSGFTREEKEFWHLKSRKIRLDSDEAYQEELRRLITDAVRRRLDAMPGLIGAELSGGLDSGAIDILINRLGREARFVSWSKDPAILPLRDGEDERRVIMDICEQEGIECSYIPQEEHFDFETMLDRVYPSFTNTPMLSYGSSVLKKQGACCVFTGHGGDEGVSHRSNRFELLYHGEFGAYFKHHWKDTEGRSLRLPRALLYCVINGFHLWKRYRGALDPESLQSDFLDRSFCDRMMREYDFQPFSFGHDPHHYVMHGGTRHRMDNTAFQGALYGVRYLYPYLDHRCIDFALSIPRSQYLGYNRDRRIFREAFRDLLPASLYDIRYKDFSSERDVKQTEEHHEWFRQEIDLILRLLDRDAWDGIVTFDQINKAQLPEMHTRQGVFDSRQINQLKRLIVIQNCRARARDWRKFDEQNKTL